jgi:aspartyl-tRNA(Asn)/glutamyl-tRNA(Gln) amidotransferase subunit B
MAEFEAVIGLETHIQINTSSKIFCSCCTDSWNSPPNSHICPVCTGLPGVLPVLNEAVVEKAVLLAEAMGAVVQSESFFDRKNYFYPDLPKGYQISQYDRPIAIGGYLEIPMPEGYSRRVGIHKLHIEEDAGKTKNAGGKRWVDYNRCGVPLVEMVTEPDIRSGDEAAQYLIRLRQLLRWIGVSEADMEKGHLRCDANVSIRLKGETILNPKTEIKNVNSIDAVREAIVKEIERQVKEVEAGHRIESWSLEWDDEKGKLKKMRSKETEADYRYFREPDLLPLKVSEERHQKILAGLPELPLQRRQRFSEEYHLPVYDADILTGERSLSDFYEQAVSDYGGDTKKVSNWMMNDILRMLNDKNLTADLLRVTPHYLADILKMVDSNTINNATAKTLLQKVQESGKAPAKIVEEEGLGVVSDEDSIIRVVSEIMAENPEEVAAYQAGKETLLGWFVGQVMRKTHGKADPNLANKHLRDLLSKKG